MMNSNTILIGKDARILKIHMLKINLGPLLLTCTQTKSKIYIRNKKTIKLLEIKE